MKKIIKTIPIQESLCDYIQRLYYEFQGLKNLTLSIMCNKDHKYDEKIFKEYLIEYKQAHSSFCIAMEELKSKYIDAAIRNEFVNVDIQVNFHECTIDIVVGKNAGTGCDTE